PTEHAAPRRPITTRSGVRTCARRPALRPHRQGGTRSALDHATARRPSHHRSEPPHARAAGRAPERRPTEETDPLPGTPLQRSKQSRFPALRRNLPRPGVRSRREAAFGRAPAGPPCGLTAKPTRARRPTRPPHTAPPTTEANRPIRGPPDVRPNAAPPRKTS